MHGECERKTIAANGSAGEQARGVKREPLCVAADVAVQAREFALDVDVDLGGVQDAGGGCVLVETGENVKRLWRRGGGGGGGGEKDGGMGKDIMKRVTGRQACRLCL